MIATCVRKDCRNAAEVLPVVLVWGKGHAPGSHPPARIQMGLPTCRRCTLDIGVVDLIPRAGWREMAREFIKRQKVAPDLNTATIEWIPLTSPEALAFLKSIPAPEKGLVH